MCRGFRAGCPGRGNHSAPWGPGEGCWGDPPEPLQTALTPGSSSKAGPRDPGCSPLPLGSAPVLPVGPPLHPGDFRDRWDLARAETQHRGRETPAREPSTGRGGNRPSNPTPGSPRPAAAPRAGQAAVCFSSAGRPANRRNVPRAWDKIAPRSSPHARPRARVTSAPCRRRGAGCPVSLLGRRHQGAESCPVRGGLGAPTVHGRVQPRQQGPGQRRGPSAAGGGCLPLPQGRDPAALPGGCGVREQASVGVAAPRALPAAPLPAVHG